MGPAGLCCAAAVSGVCGVRRAASAARCGVCAVHRGLLMGAGAMLFGMLR